MAVASFLNTLFANSEIPAWLSLLAVTFIFFYLRKDIKTIKENLTNHVTDTNKKIANFDNRFDKIDSKIDLKIDQLRTEINAKFDSHLSQILSVLGFIKKNESDSKKILKVHGGLSSLG